VVLTGAFPADNPAHPVNVPSHEMTAEVAVGPQWPLEIYQRTGQGVLQVRPFPGLDQQIKLRVRVGATPGELYRCEAAAVDCQAAARF